MKWSSFSSKGRVFLRNNLGTLIQPTYYEVRQIANRSRRKIKINYCVLFSIPYFSIYKLASQRVRWLLSIDQFCGDAARIFRNVEIRLGLDTRELAEILSFKLLTAKFAWALDDRWPLVEFYSGSISMPVPSLPVLVDVSETKHKLLLLFKQFVIIIGSGG